MTDSECLTPVHKSHPNMYSLSVKQWNPFVGCTHGCIYCVGSFQAQLKRWAKNHCQNCYDFSPHFHKPRLNVPLPKTEGREFIFVCSDGDWTFALQEWKDAIVDRIRREPDKTFLIQSKNPSSFELNEFPDNVILGTTIETDRLDLYHDVSKAPDPVWRFCDLVHVCHSRRMVTCEPIIDFNMEKMVNMINQLKPEMVWVGYDSKHNFLPEPELARTEALIDELEMRGFFVVKKLLRKAWWEPSS